MTRSWVEVSPSRLVHNVSVVRKTAPNVPLIGVVKANAYGHGVRRAAACLHELGVRAFAVADLEEARELRLCLPDAEILVFGGCDLSEAAEFRARNLTAALFREDVVPSGVRVEIKVDSGMGRLGVAPDRVGPLARRLGPELAGVFSTLACADSDPEITLRQIQRFGGATAGLRVRRHLANSAGLGFPEAHLDAVRIGLALYGISNSEATAPVLPILKWKARVLAVNMLAGGRTVGYCASHTTRRDSRIAVVGVGYADGYSRLLSNRGQVLTVDGPAPVVGRVSMDLITVDATECPRVKPGSEVVLLDDDPRSPLCAAALARDLGTIPYEVLTSIGPRVHRVYTDNQTSPTGPAGPTVPTRSDPTAETR
jgi:alanine racemase